MKLMINRSIADMDTGVVTMMAPICGFCGNEIEYLSGNYGLDWRDNYVHTNDNTPICEATNV